MVKSDNSIWFTDPAYGIDTDYEGDRQKQEIDGCHVYRIDPKSGAVDRVITDMVRPNGIAFSLDEKYLYVADTGATHVENGPRHIRRFTVDGNGKSVKGGEVFAKCDRRPLRRLPRRLEGPHLDEHGRGRPLLRPGRHADRQEFSIPEIVANVTFGGAKLNRLFICGTTSLYSLLPDHQRVEARLTGGARAARLAATGGGANT